MFASMAAGLVWGLGQHVDSLDLQENPMVSLENSQNGEK
jgi:hypothetical protein